MSQQGDKGGEKQGRLGPELKSGETLAKGPEPKKDATGGGTQKLKSRTVGFGLWTQLN